MYEIAKITSVEKDYGLPLATRFPNFPDAIDIQARVELALVDPKTRGKSDQRSAQQASGHYRQTDAQEHP